MRTRKNEGGYIVLAALLLAATLIIFLTTAIRLNYEWHKCNQKELKQLNVEASRR